MKQLKTVFKRGVAALLAMCLLGGASAVLADSYRITEFIVTEPDVPSEQNAYILFSKKPQEHLMSYVRGSNDKNDVLYSENVVFGGIECQQVFVQNKFHMTFAPGFAKPEDRQFCFIMDYWDYSGGGSYRLEYTMDEAGNTKTVTIPKTGKEGTNNYQWHRVSVVVGDACFTQSMENGADFRILSNAYNAYSKIEVVNLSDKADTTDDLGSFNMQQAKALHILGLYDGLTAEDGSFDPALERELTVETALAETVKLLGLGRDAEKAAVMPQLNHVSDENKPYVGYAEKMGWIDDADLQTAEEPLTQRQLLRVFIAATGNGCEAGKEQETAETLGIVKGENLIFQMKKNATYDTLIGLARNTQMVKEVKSGISFLGKMLRDGITDGNAVAASGDTELVNSVLLGEVKIMPDVTVDPATGRTYYSLSLFGQDAIKGYYTAQLWAPDNKRFYFRDAAMHMYEYNIETNIVKYLDDLHNEHCICVSQTNQLFYINPKREIMAMDLSTYEKRKIADPPVGSNPNIVRTMNMLEVNDAGTKATVYWREIPEGYDEAVYYKKRTWFPILDIATGTWDMRWSYGFTDGIGWPDPNHNTISPKYDNLMIFAHEGDMVRDRTWALNTDTGQFVNAFKQKDYIEGKFTGEIFCHEGWVCDGYRTFGVKSSRSWNLINQTIGHRGLVISNWDNTERYYANGDYNYLHIGASPASDRWFAGDTSYSGNIRNTNLVLIDAHASQSYLLAQPRQNGKNPGHAHPQFSQNGQWVTFGLWSEDGKHVKIGWMDVSDITDAAKPVSHYDLSDSCDTTSALDTSHKLTVRKEGDVNVFVIPKDNHMKVNVKSSAVYAESADVRVTVEYLDSGYLPIRLQYNTWHVLGAYNRLTDREVYIERRNTGSYQTKSFVLQNASMDNMQWLGTDFNLSGVKSAAVIKSVRVEPVSD